MSAQPGCVAADAQTTSVTPNLKLGLVPAMAVRQGASGPFYNSYTRFDLSALPDDPTVQKAILRLWVLAVVTPDSVLPAACAFTDRETRGSA